MKRHGQARGILMLRSSPAGLLVVRNPAPKTIHPRVNPWSSGAWIKTRQKDCFLLEFLSEAKTNNTKGSLHKLL